MLILGIDTATVQASCAVGGHEGVLAAVQSAKGRRHAEHLAPSIGFACDASCVLGSSVSCLSSMPLAFASSAAICLMRSQS